jgi:transcription-repair coupling factor (superfamily II helicase)
LLLSAIARDAVRPLAIVVADEKEAETLRCDLEAGGLRLLFHAPSPTLTPYQRIAQSLKAQREEFTLLAALRGREMLEAAVLPARSLFTRLPTPADFDGMVATVREGEELSLSRFVARLTEAGYRRGDLVIEAGDLAVRGGLFDLYPPDRDLPIRIELDGDQVASIRVFDPDTQRSRERLSSVAIVPFADAVVSEEQRLVMAERLGRLPSEVEKHVFAAAVCPMPSGWLDHAARCGAILVVVEPQAVADEISRFAERLVADRDPDRDPFLPEELCLPAEPLLQALEEATLIFDRIGLTAAAKAVRLPAEAIAGHAGRTAEAATEMGVLEAGEEVSSRHNRRGAEKLKRRSRIRTPTCPERRGGALISVPAEISAGFRLRQPRVAVYAESEIFGEEKKARVVRGRASEAFLSDLRDLKLGDAVVHRDYGIGLFKGLKRVPVGGEQRELMEIGYAEEKVLILP